jgi:hypothetical protein
MAKLPPFPLDRLKNVFAYCPDTGRLTWLVVPSGNVAVGQIAGCLIKDGYRKVVVENYQTYAHHVAWYFITGDWPSEQIDHVNGDRADNRACNLRLATQSQQNYNTKINVANTSGHKGVARCSKTNRWRAYITVGKKQKFLGNHMSFEDAVSARRAAEHALCGEFSRTLRQEAGTHAQGIR